MNLPLSLTLLRIFFVPLVVVLLLTKGHNMDGWAVGVFLAAAATDLLDGHLARRRGQITKLGILLDPVADKLLTSAAFISLVERGYAPAWIVVIIVGREFAVSGLRAIASAEGYVLAASELGKTKMVLEVAAISAIVVERHVAVMAGWHLGVLLLWLVMLFALVSAGQYFWMFWREMDSRMVSRAKAAAIPTKVEKEPEESVVEEKNVAAQ
ncbi:MAG: CDP-diacylglycerol--glycerol-3-phosphate 3-phosphatidyltransferase [Acidobacteria bacterium]|nr:MAG: CDP-diacylglycerol--glycerol-3-phosphate 3-phosphatidyltransferase [Acidobacteriota bacterium]